VRAGVQEIYVAATHGIFSGPAIERLRQAPIKEVVVTDTVPLPLEKRLPKITVISVASLFAEAIQRIHAGGSVGALFR
ncbi:MAG TPA: ribose-phosphate diphosphokinase, partial [Chloroflexota bacterium]|nr:ribose-phosphate diphosphokinase [Chloroflexota bacterium]